MSGEHTGREGLDPALLRGLTQRRMSRRRFLRSVSLGAGSLGLSSLLAACGIRGAAPEREPGAPRRGEVGSPEWWAKQEITGQLDFANWPYYIDRVRGGAHPSLDMFTDETGIVVNYRPVIQANETFFATIRPSLEAGEPIGWDIIVITNGPILTKLINFGWLIALDPTRRPNFDRYASELVKDPAYDPGNTYTMAWQSGFTGIGYNIEAIGREVTSTADLFNPEFAGKVGMFNIPDELGSLALLHVGVDPFTSTPEDWERAAEVLRKQRDDGIVRQYYDQSYIKALQDGDVWIAQAWSGDIFQSNALGFKELRFAAPDEGVMFWTDNMMIPRGAAHPLDALTYMDFVYRPDVAALIADWVWYVTPVPEAKEYILDEERFASILGELPGFYSPAPGKSPLVFPDEEMKAKARDYRIFETPEELDRWNELFLSIVEA